MNLANCLTTFRLVGAFGLIFLPPLSFPFYLLYSLCGVSDGLDGPIARRSNTQSEFGAKLDSVADLVFYTVLLIRLLPAMIAALPRWIWYWVAGILLGRVGTYTVAACKYHCFSSRHTWLNKLTGFSLFMVPYALSQPFFPVYGNVVCAIASLAALEELTLHLLSPEYDPACKSIFNLKK